MSDALAHAPAPAAAHATDLAAPQFHRRAVRWMVGVVAVSLLATAVLIVFGYDFEFQRSSKNDSYSTSALGHRGLRGMLERLGVPVLSSRNRTSRRAADHGVLVVAEPDSHEGLRSMLLTPGASLVVLPKWTGHENPKRPGWLAGVSPTTPAHVEAILDAITEQPELLDVVRTMDPAGEWRTELPGGDIAPAEFLMLQLIAHGDGEGDGSGNGSAFEPILSCAHGTLLGVLTLPDAAGPTYVLSDPDLIANHGLLRGDNAVTAVRIVDALRTGTGPVVFEETVHGHTAHPSIFRELFRYPLILGTLQVMLAGAVLAWLALVRFGTPLDPGARLGAGKRYLIDHLAAVQRLNGHTPAALRRYYRRTVQLVARRLNIPPYVEGKALETWLARTESVRRPDRTLAEVRGDVIAADQGGRTRLTAAAQAVHHWREEMLRGS